MRNEKSGSEIQVSMPFAARVLPSATGGVVG